MGNKQSTLDTKAKIQDGLLTFIILNCENSSAFPGYDQNHEEVIKIHSGHKLTVSIDYNGKTEKVSCDYYKNSVWNKGVIQHEYVQSINECTIKLGSTSTKSPNYRNFDFDFNQYDQGQIIRLEIKDVNSSPDSGETTIDGADIEQPGNNSVILNILYTTNLKTLKESNTIIQTTRNSNDHLSVMQSFDHLDNGDIILYSGSSPISEIIRDRFYRPWSHVGVVIKTYPFINHIKGQELSEEPVHYVIEAVGKEGIKDPFRKNQVLTGVNIFPLKERIKEYDGYNVQAIRLAKPFTERQKERFLTNCFELHGARLPFDVFQAAILLLERLKKWNWVSDKSVFCSELATICLFRAGVLTDCENYPSNTDPGEVSEFLCFKDSKIQFLKYDI
ncbi:hypothetical protein RB653_003748 [Dictyostelium firmibasis]|uniref:Uncharacterized protein n=1 Tax=Dictyostelium firmibasis TaxID=79012 RepID=A0AAN7U9H7_9MYCE